jgi:peptidyl-prolyl cis-trans isomerase SurA
MKGDLLMKFNQRAAFLFFGVLLLLIGCAPKQSDVIVAEIGTNKVGMGEYENFFAKNSGGWEAAKESSLTAREHFLELLVNYRLKLQDAYGRKLQDDPELVSELQEYRSSLASSFLVDKEINDPGVRRLYNLRKEEIRAQYILIMVKQDASPEDTAKAWAKAMEVIKHAQADENFDSLVSKYSEDAASRDNHGDIYYFTGGMLMFPLEAAAYSMKKGEVSSMPVRTPLGYDILKITDRQPSRGSIKVRHIMTRLPAPSDSAQDTSAAYTRIMAMRDSLKKGSDFAALATKFSEDGGSAPTGGDLGWFERRKWIQPFDEAAFKLAAGQNSPIVRTQYGYHLIHCDSVRSIPTFEEMQEDLKKLYQQYRFNDDFASYIEKLKHDYNYIFNETLFNSLATNLDSTKTIEDSAWIPGIGPDLRKQMLYTINGKGKSLDSALTLLTRRPEYKNTSLRKSELVAKFEHIGEGFLFNERAIGLESRYSDFASLMKDYEDGIVLFKAEQTQVWNKISISDTLLKKYFNENREKFTTQPKVNFAEIHVATDTLAMMLYDSLSKGADFGKLADAYNTDEDLKGKHGIRGPQPVSDEYTKYVSGLSIGETSDPLPAEQGGFSLIKVIAKEQPRQKTFEESGAEVSNALQESESKRLENEWLDQLKIKYPVKEYKEQLTKAFLSGPPAK